MDYESRFYDILSQKADLEYQVSELEKQVAKLEGQRDYWLTKAERLEEVVNDYDLEQY